MSSIYTIIFCLLLIGLRVSCEELVENRVERQDSNTPDYEDWDTKERDFCKYKNITVRVYGASLVNEELLLVLTLQKNNEMNESKTRGVFRSVYVENETHISYSKFYSAQPFTDLRKEINRQPNVSVKYMFNANNHKDYPFPKSDEKNRNWNINYIHFSDGITKGYNIGRKVLAPNDNSPLPQRERFVIQNDKVFYDKNGDKSGFINLRLLYSYFPEEVEITAIMIINVKFTGKEDEPKYIALVYTAEKWPQSCCMYVRHYLNGTGKHYNAYDYDYWQIHWDLDPRQKYCTRLDKRVYAVTKIYEYDSESHIHFKFVEFYETNHKFKGIDVKPPKSPSQTNYDYTMNENEDDPDFEEEEQHKHRVNSLLLNCENFTDTRFVGPHKQIDCSPKFLQRDTSGQDFIDPITIPILPSSDTLWSQILESGQQTESPTFWIKFFIFATIVTIVAIIGFGIYLLVTENKKTKNL